MLFFRITKNLMAVDIHGASREMIFPWERAYSRWGIRWMRSCTTAPIIAEWPSPLRVKKFSGAQEPISILNWWNRPFQILRNISSRTSGVFWKRGPRRQNRDDRGCRGPATGRLYHEAVPGVRIESTRGSGTSSA